MPKIILSPDAIPASQDPAGREPAWVYECDATGAIAGSVARIAERCHGAEAGAPGRLVGNSYALPTCDEKGELLPATEFAAHVRAFLDCAASEPGRHFRLLPGTKRRTEQQLSAYAEMLRNAPGNVRLPGRMLELLGKLDAVRIVLLDMNARITEPERRRKALDEYFTCNAGLWGTKHVEIVSFGAPQVLVLNEEYARAKGYGHRILRVDAEVYGRERTQAAEILSIAYATKLLCVGDPMGTSTGTHIGSVRLATGGGLEVDEVMVGDSMAA
ncbi:MAG: A1S_2505 family phage non-structural protein [Gammaproteobacteria bacterium]